MPEPKAKKTIRICIYDTHRVVGQALTELVSKERDLQVVATCNEPNETIRVCRDGPVDVVLLDISAGDSSHLMLLEGLMDEDFQGHAAVVAASLTDEEVVQLTNLGVDGII